MIRIASITTARRIDATPRGCYSELPPYNSSSITRSQMLSSSGRTKSPLTVSG